MVISKTGNNGAPKLLKDAHVTRRRIRQGGENSSLPSRKVVPPTKKKAKTFLLQGQGES